jgi:type IV pilus assembly protein PilM
MAQIIVGLDVGSRNVRAVRLRAGFRTMELEEVVARGVDEDPWPAIREMAQGADVVFTAVPGDQVSFRKLELPRAASKRLEQVIPFELDGEVPFEIDSLVMHHRVLGQTSDRLDVLAVAASHAKVAAHLATLSEHGLNPREVVPAPLALAELARLAAPAGHVAVLDIGHASTDITVARSGELVAARTISFGGRDVTAALARVFEAPEAVAQEWLRTEQYLYDGDLGDVQGEGRLAVEAVCGAVDTLVRAVKQTLAARELETGATVERLVLCGGTSRLSGLPEYLSSRLGLPVERFSVPATAMGGATDVDVLGGGKALALAVHGAAPRGRRLNLRQGDLAFEGEVRAGKGILLYAVAALVLIMFAWGFSAYARRVSLRSENEAQTQSLATQSKRLLGKQLGNFDELELLIGRAAKTKAGESPIPQLDAFDVVEQISKLIPEKINHEIDTLDIRGGRVQIQGRVDQRRDADEIEAALSRWDDCFVKVQVTRTTPAVRDNRLQYTMDIETRCP